VADSAAPLCTARTAGDDGAAVGPANAAAHTPRDRHRLGLPGAGGAACGGFHDRAGDLRDLSGEPRELPRAAARSVDVEFIRHERGLCPVRPNIGRGGARRGAGRASVPAALGRTFAPRRVPAALCLVGRGGRAALAGDLSRRRSRAGPPRLAEQSEHRAPGADAHFHLGPRGRADAGVSRRMPRASMAREPGAVSGASRCRCSGP